MNPPSDHGGEPRWKHDGVRVIGADQLDPNTAQTPGMDRKAAINFARVGAQKLWAGTVHIHANAKTGAHHHGPLESVIYIVKGRARMRWGEHLEFTAEAGPGDFIDEPPRRRETLVPAVAVAAVAVVAVVTAFMVKRAETSSPQQAILEPAGQAAQSAASRPAASQRSDVVTAPPLKRPDTAALGAPA